MSVGNLMEKQVTWEGYFKPSNQQPPQVNAWSKTINSWDKSFIGGGECDVGASTQENIIMEDGRLIKGKEDYAPINWHVLEPIMALGGFKITKL